MATNKQRYQISVSDRMLREIVAFQEENNIATRSGAIQELIRLGIQVIQNEERDKERQRLEEYARRLADE